MSRRSKKQEAKERSNPEKVAIASEAERLLNGVVGREVFDIVRENILEDWMSTSGDQYSEREMCYARMRGLKDVEAQLRKYMDEGEFAQLAINREA